MDDYVKIQDIHEVQKLLYKLTNEFHTLCERYNLTYNLYGGSLLGAVRHQGMIPWDDDIDVSMPRDDYEKLIRIVEEKHNDRYRFFYAGCENYGYPFGKFCYRDSLLIEEGVCKKNNRLALYIDIFPFDGFGPEEDADNRFKYLRKLHVMRTNSLSKIKISPIWWKKPFVIPRAIYIFIMRFIGYKFFLKREVAESKRYPFSKSEYVCCVAASWMEKGKIAKEKYIDRTLYKFGDYYIWGIKDYNENLTNLYGDYMTPPPIEKRVSNHLYSLYVKKTLLEELK